MVVVPAGAPLGKITSFPGAALYWARPDNQRAARRIDIVHQRSRNAYIR